MSCVLLEEEHAATLEEVLAFLEATTHDDDGNGDDSTDSDRSLLSSTAMDAAASPPSPEDKDGSTDGDEKGEQNQPPPQRRRRRALKKTRDANNKAVGRYRQRNKDEILDLRGKVREMEARLTQLRRERDVAAAVSAKNALLEMFAKLLGVDAVGSELRKLQQSRLLNHKLKRTLVEYVNMSKASERLFQKRITKQVRCSPLSFVVLLHLG